MAILQRIWPQCEERPVHATAKQTAASKARVVSSV